MRAPFGRHALHHMLEIFGARRLREARHKVPDIRDRNLFLPGRFAALFLSERGLARLLQKCEPHFFITSTPAVAYLIRRVDLAGADAPAGRMRRKNTFTL